MAHIGILKVFDKYGIKISSLAGSSAGATIGAAYALGIEPENILKWGETLNKKKFLRFSNFHLFSESLIKSKDMANSIKVLLGDKTFKDTKIPFVAIAVDLELGEEVVIKEGKLWEAARASSAIPGILSPYMLNGQYLVDGGLLNSVPVNHLRAQKNIDIVIGVELGNLTSRQYVSGMIWEKYYHKPERFKLYPGFLTRLKVSATLMFHILLRSLDIVRDEAQEARYKIAKPDFIIKPKLEGISLLEFNRYKEAYAEGQRAAEEAMPKIFELIEQKKNELNKET